MLLAIDPDSATALPGEPLPLQEPALHALSAIRAALAGHALCGDPAELEPGLVAARELIATLPGTAGPHLSELRRLGVALPEFGDLLDAAAWAAGDAVTRACASLWQTLGLHSPPPRWTSTEHDAARMVFACACAAPANAEQSPEWLSASLRRLSAARIAGELCAELAHSEAVWLRALGGRYGSLRHRCAPRTALRSRGLSDLLRSDEVCRAGVLRRVERWAATGLGVDELSAELEAAVVHARTPSRLA